MISILPYPDAVSRCRSQIRGLPAPAGSTPGWRSLGPGAQAALRDRIPGICSLATEQSPGAPARCLSGPGMTALARPSQARRNTGFFCAPRPPAQGVKISWQSVKIICQRSTASTSENKEA